jgi:ketosteroid isomerase-like protein
MTKWLGILLLGSSVLIMSPVLAGSEEAAIEKTIVAVSRAFSDFPRTRDRRSILRFYRPGFTSLQDGHWYTAKEFEKYLSEIEAQILPEAPFTIDSRVAHVNAEVSGLLGWATYDYSYKIARGKTVVQEERGKCTGIFRKETASWLIEHEHCSKLEDDRKP